MATSKRLILSMYGDDSDDKMVYISLIRIQKELIFSNVMFEFVEVVGCFSENEAIGTGIFISVWSVERICVYSLTSNCYNQIFQEKKPSILYIFHSKYILTRFPNDLSQWAHPFKLNFYFSFKIRYFFYSKSIFPSTLTFFNEPNFNYFIS